MASGYFEEIKSIMFVLIDATSMKVTDTLKVNKNSSCGTRHIQLFKTNGRLFAVAGRLRQYVDIIEVCHKKLASNFNMCMAVDVTDGNNHQIQ